MKLSQLSIMSATWALDGPMWPTSLDGGQVFAQTHEICQWAPHVEDGDTNALSKVWTAHTLAVPEPSWDIEPTLTTAKMPDCLSLVWSPTFQAHHKHSDLLM